MVLNRQSVRDCLQQCDYGAFETLFLEELGWDAVDRTEIPVGDRENSYMARAFAEKKGVYAYHCAAENSGDLPDRSSRQKISKAISEYTREHIVIYTDDAQLRQVWQWVRREKGKPIVSRETSYRIDQDGEGLIQKLEAIAISIDEETALTLPDVTKKVKNAFDIDKVTKKFYERFQKEHQRFLEFVTGIQERFDQEWYCSVMLNRLMFVYFLQKKGFLDGDTDYLRRRLNVCQQAHGDDEFYSFYRYFLLRLFHEGLGDSKRDSAELEQLIGEIPYLNGGLFDVHELEERNPDIQIPDDAFEAIFNFFDEYEWHLDDRSSRSGREINPDVLGYVFEKYINQKQMGAYYTKEDITEYISKNTVIPFLFDAAKKGCAVAFEPDGPVWRLLRENPERYIYAAVKKGVLREDSGTKVTEVVALPSEIAAGIEDVSQRAGWNRLAAAEYALPTELWREHVARRQRCLEIWEKLKAGEVHEINDLITYNLDIRQFAQDVIEQCEGPDLLRAFYKAISEISVLDPTCGSGAFLFAALNILEPLYDACLKRMAGFVEDLDRSGEKARPEKFSDFRKTLEQVAKHPNREYFILKQIILGNLYGVDIMEEAVEICKLRLFLKLVSEVDADVDRPNYGLEPLPDIDFNIRAGNTLVGFATYDEVKKTVEGDGQQKLDLFSDMPRIDESAEIADRAFQMFRKQQTEHDMDAARFKDAKLKVRRQLKELNDELNRYLANEYGVNADKSKAFKAWLRNHQPFHWFVEFYRIIKDGGFDVTIGNPPYVEYSKIRKAYSITQAPSAYLTNLYSTTCYRATRLKRRSGYSSFIVPVSLPSTDRMSQLRAELMNKSSVYHTSFSTRPSKLFEGAEQRLTIYIQVPSSDSKLFSGGYLKWYKEERETLFENVAYVQAEPYTNRKSIWLKPKGQLGKIVIDRILQFPTLEESEMLGSTTPLYYKNTGIRNFNTVTLRPPKCWINGESQASSRETILTTSKEFRNLIHALLLSTTFFVYYEATSNCRDLNPSDIKLFPSPSGNVFSEALENIEDLSVNIEKDYTSKGKIIRMNNKKTGVVELESLSPANSKNWIDRIDRVFARYYGFSDVEADFITNYDIKYRMGSNSFRDS